MGIREDGIELGGTQLEKALLMLEETGGMLVKVGDRWTPARARPAEGGGPYYEKMPDGEIRLWDNNGGDTYQRIREGKKRRR